MAITAANILTAESMIASSWPALTTSLSGRWLLGMADGLSGRANSLFFLDASDDKNVSERIDWMEKTYAKVGLAPRVRLSPLAPLAVLNDLKARNYSFEKPILTFHHAHQNLKTPKKCLEIKQYKRAEEIWISTFLKTTPHYKKQKNTLLKIHNAILDETTYYLGFADGKPVATVMAVTQMNVTTYQNLAVLSAYQRQGFAFELMTHTLKNAAEKQESWSFLAVETHNEPAIKLYRKLGFEEFYRYIYAVKKKADQS